jgi:hypothetical protein
MADYDALRQSDLVFAFGTLGMKQQLGRGSSAERRPRRPILTF